MRYSLLFVLSLIPFFASANTCVDVDLNGYLVSTTESIEDCTTSVVLTKDEYTKASNTFAVFNMTKSESYELSTAFLLMLSVALVIKIAMRQLLPK